MFDIRIPADIRERQDRKQAEIRPCNYRWFIIGDIICDQSSRLFYYRRQKPVASPKNSLNVLGTVRTFAQRSTKNEYMLRKISLLNKLVWPYLLQQIVLLHYFSFSPYQSEKRTHYLRRQRH